MDGLYFEHRGASPRVDPDAYVASTATLIGAVVVHAGARILHGAVLTAEDGKVTIGENSIVMENALVRGRSGHPAQVGRWVLIGPHAHVNGASIADECFIATGASLFPGSRLEHAAEIRINAVVQVNTTLAENTVVPIGWIAVGSPAQLFAPGQHDELWRIQRSLDFSGTVYGVDRGTSMREIMSRQSDFYGAHRDDRQLTAVDVRRKTWSD